jgi:hypothetical protein
VVLSNWIPIKSVLGAATLATIAMLAGCSGVVSSTPWYSRADAQAAPQLRDGVWRITSRSQSPCKVRESAPLQRWPSCASAIVVRKLELRALSDTKAGWKWSEAAYILAGDAPTIVQITDVVGGKTSYEYAWARATKRDDQQRVIAIQGWRVLCGPPTPAASAQAPLYPGLTNDKGDCDAASPDAIRQAALTTEADYPDRRFEAHWIRDGER